MSKVDKLDFLPLRYAVTKGTPANILFLSQWEKNFDVNVKSPFEGKTAVHIAVEYGKLQNLICLHELGANLNLPDKHGDYPIHYAAKYGKTEIFLWLIKNGVSLSQESKNERHRYQSIHIAAQHARQKILEIAENYKINFYSPVLLLQTISILFTIASL